MSERIKIEYNEESGLFHLSLLIDGEYIEISMYNEQCDAEQAADDINRFVQE